MLVYNPKYREYGIKISNSTGSCALMDYCVACGKKLPLSLRKQWFDILENEYRLESPRSEDIDKVPEEFWTDGWWKERGL